MYEVWENKNRPNNDRTAPTNNPSASTSAPSASLYVGEIPGLATYLNIVGYYRDNYSKKHCSY